MTTTPARSVSPDEVIALALRLCGAAGVLGVDGTISARDADDPRRMWIDGRRCELADGPALHREIYQRRPDVNAIVHAAPETIAALAAAGRRLEQVVTVNPFIPDGGAAVADGYAALVPASRGSAVAEALGAGPIVVLRHGGAVTVGASVEEAVIRMICAEDNARVQYRALQIGTPNVIRGGERRTIVDENLDPKIIRKFWTYWEETANRSRAR